MSAAIMTRRTLLAHHPIAGGLNDIDRKAHLGLFDDGRLLIPLDLVGVFHADTSLIMLFSNAYRIISDKSSFAVSWLKSYSFANLSANP